MGSRPSIDDQIRSSGIDKPLAEVGRSLTLMYLLLDAKTRGPSQTHQLWIRFGLTNIATFTKSITLWAKLPSRPIFAFAGVWRPTKGGGAYAFLTCGYDGDPSTHLVGAIHPKAVPVVLHQEDEERWLTAPIDDALTLACVFPSQLMAARRE